MADEVRIGVFVCHCGINIGKAVNVPEVVSYARTLPHVTHAEENLFTCSEEGVSSIRDKIHQHGLTRVVVASCTPRTHEPLFRAACEEAGLNKYLFDLVNIRDQCSWVHMHEPDEATAKAKDLVRMGVARAKYLRPLEEIETPVEPAALVIGGGPAGMTAAVGLAAQGFEVHLVERQETLGGTLRRLHSLFPTGRSGADTLARLEAEVAKHDRIRVHYQTEVDDVSGFIGNFRVRLRSPAGITEHPVGTVIVATGGEELRPDGQYGHGRLPNVMTQLELEARLMAGSPAGRHVVMINCVGARVPERTYCGRFCCMTAIKNATLLKEIDPTTTVHVLHRDVMAYGVDFESLYRKSMELGVRYVRYDPARPPEVVGDEAAMLVRLWHPLLGREVELPVGTVVLTTPQVPHADNERISKMLKVPLSEQGFFLEAHLKLQPVEFATDGVYLAGSARWPTDLSEAIAQGHAAVAKAAIPMRKGYVRPEAATATVDESRCAGCGFCVAVCAYKAVELLARDGRMVSSINRALCKGCGTCTATCPSGVIRLDHFDNTQILAQIRAMVGSRV